MGRVALKRNSEKEAQKEVTTSTTSCAA
jgi:hypothetical protein